MMGTRILKIDLEIAEIIEVKVATFSIEIIFMPLCNSKMSIFKNFCAHVANFLNFSKLPRILAEKLNRVETDLWDTL